MADPEKTLRIGMVQDPCPYEDASAVVGRHARDVHAWMIGKSLGFDQAFDGFFKDTLSARRKSDREKSLIRESKEAMRLEVELFRHIWETHDHAAIASLRSFSSYLEVLRECSRGVYLLMQRGQDFDTAFDTYFQPWLNSSQVIEAQKGFIRTAKERMKNYIDSSKANW